MQRFPANSPPASSWYGLAFDAWRGVHVLFGGGVSGTWEWNGLDWLQRTLPISPPARSTHVLAFDVTRGFTVLHGGRTVSGQELTDTWEFDGANWVQRLPMQSPSPRQSAGMAFSSARGRLVLFGGMSTNAQALQDTWEWDGNNWTQLTTATVMPLPRHSFAMTSDFVRGRVLLFGGFDGGFGELSDAWAFDAVGWAPLPATQSPPVRREAMLAADLGRGMLVLFGGMSVENVLTVSRETWLHDGSDWRRDPRPTSIPPRRAGASSYDWARDRAVLFGGFSGVSFLGDTWEYDLAGVALWSVAGVGCAGSQGVPHLRPVGPQRAIVGTSHTLAVSGGVTGGALFALGFSNTNWNGNALPLPLASYGMPGCQVHTSLDATFFAAGIGGAAQLALAMPNNPGLVGVQFFAQALVPQPGVNAAGAVMSNAVVNVIGSF